LKFEDAEKELAQIVERLESGQVPLEDAVALWERGEELYRLCRAQLDVAQGKVEELAARVESAKPTTAPSPD
jgi:exodeoxyribonuclease VII small subunit